MFKRKILLVILSFLLLLSSSSFSQAAFNSPPANKTYNYNEMTDYEMFWPIAAGRIPGDKFYNLKIWRDKFVIKLIFNPIKKSEYYKTLANKRLVEAIALLEIKRDAFLGETLIQSGNNMEKGLELLSSSQPSLETTWLKGEYSKDLRKYQVVLGRLAGTADSEELKIINPGIEKIKGLITKYNF